MLRLLSHHLERSHLLAARPIVVPRSTRPQASRHHIDGMLHLDISGLNPFRGIKKSPPPKRQASEWVAGQMPNARRVDFANSGHAPHLEEPDLFNHTIEKFADAMMQ